MMDRREITDYFREYEELKIDAIERELSVPHRSDFIVSIVGPRRAGKTYYLLSLRDKLKDAAYLNFEDTRLYGATYKDIREVIRIFAELYGKFPKYLLLDEIQEVDKWELAVRELHDLRKYRILLTGSSSKLLSKEIATNLRGRTLTYLLLPFSFREFLRIRGFQPQNLTMDEESLLRNLLREYLEFGGFPDVVKNPHKLKILREYSDLILFRDFIERHKIKNIEVARYIHLHILQNFAREISAKRIYDRIRSSNIRVSKDSVYSYISKLEDTMFFFFLRKYTEKVHMRESWPKKIYLCDTGLSKVVKYSEDLGKLMENAVFLELMRKKNANPLLEIFYMRNQRGEVDFVVKEGGSVSELIQVTYASGEDEIRERELPPLIKAGEDLKCKKLTVITWDYEERKGNVEYIPLYKYLLTGIGKNLNNPANSANQWL